MHPPMYRLLKLVLVLFWIHGTASKLETIGRFNFTKFPTLKAILTDNEVPGQDPFKLTPGHGWSEIFGDLKVNYLGNLSSVILVPEQETNSVELQIWRMENEIIKLRHLLNIPVQETNTSLTYTPEENFEMLVGDMIGLWINSSSAYPLHRIRRQENYVKYSAASHSWTSLYKPVVGDSFIEAANYSAELWDGDQYQKHPSQHIPAINLLIEIDDSTMVTARSDTDVQPIVTTSTTTEPPPTVTKTTQTRDVTNHTTVPSTTGGRGITTTGPTVTTTEEAFTLGEGVTKINTSNDSSEVTPKPKTGMDEDLKKLLIILVPIAVIVTLVIIVTLILVYRKKDKHDSEQLTTNQEYLYGTGSPPSSTHYEYTDDYAYAIPVDDRIYTGDSRPNPAQYAVVNKTGKLDPTRPTSPVHMEENELYETIGIRVDTTEIEMHDNELYTKF